MPPARIRYHEDVDRDLEEIPANLRTRLKTAIETRIAVEPRKVGEPLREELSGLRKLRVGDYRIVYEVESDRVTIWGIQHRKGVYPAMVRRWLRNGD